MKKKIQYVIVFLFLAVACRVLAYQPRVAYLQTGNIQINNPQTSQAFYDELNGNPREYLLNSSQNFNFYLNLMVPEAENPNGIYSANVFSLTGSNKNQIATLDGSVFTWQEYYNSFDRDYYLKGPEFSKNLPAGKYEIEVYSKDNKGKYILLVGKNPAYDTNSVLNIFWQLPFLKLTFTKTSVLQFFLTPFGIGAVSALGALLVFLALIYFFVGVIAESIKHRRAKTLLLTSGGMAMKEEIMKLLQKPSYDVSVAFVTTAAKPLENLDYLKEDWRIMKEELRFNIEEVDIEGKNEAEVMQLLQPKDIIFVEGGNTFYLLKAMRACNFEKIIRKLLNEGKVYIGASAGSIVAGKTIKTAGWENGDENIVKLRDLKGLNLVNFDVFVHYLPEDAEIIKKHMPFKWVRRKLKILTDEQAILVQGREVDLIGKGEKICV